MNYQSCTPEYCPVRKLNPFLRPHHGKVCEFCWLGFMNEFGHFPVLPACKEQKFEIPTTYRSN